MKKIGFDLEKYLKVQKEAVEERLSHFSERLYLEFGGKLMDDYHAVRTLPGYDANAKLKLLKSLGRKLGVIYCVSAKQLANGKVRGDWGLGYDAATLRALGELRAEGLTVEGVVINRYDHEREADIFERKLRELGFRVIKRKEIEGYPNDLKKILSIDGFGNDEYLKPQNKLVVVWGAGPGSGKLSTCLGQIYHEVKQGLNSGYAKFETFPVWDLPLEHPVNVAYEASTADLGDFNLIDPFHKKKYNQDAVNYNRDVESFPIIKSIFNKMLGGDNFTRGYESPTDMGFNRLSAGFADDEILRKAAAREVIFYLFRYREEYKVGLVEKDTLERMEKLLKKLKVDEENLAVVPVAREARRSARKKEGKGSEGIFCGAAIEMSNGVVVSGKNSPLLHAEAAVILNAVKREAGIDDEFDLISPSIIREVNGLNLQLGDRSCSLDASEMMLAWAISARDNPLAKKGLKYLDRLRGCFMHTTHRPSAADCSLFRKIGIWVSTDGMVE